MSDASGRLTISLPADLVAQLRERQAQAQAITGGMNVSLGEVARYYIARGLAVDTRYATSDVPSVAR